VVRLASSEPRWEVSSFLSASWYGIIPHPTPAVKLYTRHDRLLVPSRSINHCDREWSGPGARPGPDHAIWPRMAPPWSTNVAYNSSVHCGPNCGRLRVFGLSSSWLVFRRGCSRSSGWSFCWGAWSSAPFAPPA